MHFERARCRFEETLKLAREQGYPLLTATLWLERLRVRLELGELAALYRGVRRSSLE